MTAPGQSGGSHTTLSLRDSQSNDPTVSPPASTASASSPRYFMSYFVTTTSMVTTVPGMYESAPRASRMRYELVLSGRATHGMNCTAWQNGGMGSGAWCNGR